MTTRTDIEQVLWNGANTFRGIIGASTYKDYLLPLLFVKYLSDIYKENIDELKKKYPNKERFERAKEDLESAHNTYDSGEFRTANNRAYYAVFHALRAVLALDQYDSKKHSGIISEFRKRYVKTQIFESSVSDMSEILSK